MAWPTAIGPPTSTHRDIRHLVNNGFVVGYDRDRDEAAWVAYRAQPVAAYRAMPRPPFTADPRLAARKPSPHYGGPDYDRGHLAPNYLISQVYGRQAQRQSFYYSNVAPQRPRLNQLVWQRLEEIEADALAARAGALWVVLGPIRGTDPSAPPQAFFRLWIARTPSNDWALLALRVPQSVRGDERLSDFIVPIDRIEQETGLDFLSGLSAARQRALESRAAPATTLDFDALACEPARYGRRWQGRDGIELRYDRCD